MYRLLKKIRCFILVWLTHNMALPLLQLLRNEQSFPYTMQELATFREESLGKKLERFLVEKKLDLLPHYARHDIKHILLEYDTTEQGEVCLQSFMLGNGHVSFPVIATVFYGWLTMPEYYPLFRQAFNRGKHSAVIKDWDWYALLPESTVNLQKIISQIPQAKKESNYRL